MTCRTKINLFCQWHLALINHRPNEKYTPVTILFEVKNENSIHCPCSASFLSQAQFKSIAVTSDNVAEAQE